MTLTQLFRLSRRPLELARSVRSLLAAVWAGASTSWFATTCWGLLAHVQGLVHLHDTLGLRARPAAGISARLGVVKLQRQLRRRFTLSRTLDEDFMTRSQGGPLQNVELLLKILLFPQICKLQNHRSPMNTQPVPQEQRYVSKKMTYSMFCKSVAVRHGDSSHGPCPLMTQSELWHTNNRAGTMHTRQQ